MKVELEISKQLENEEEQQKYIEMIPCIPELSSGVKNLLVEGVYEEKSKDYSKIATSLYSTRLNAFLGKNNCIFSKYLLTSNDFIRVTVTSNFKGDHDTYLRPPKWLARAFTKEKKEYFIFISSFEANKLLKEFGESVQIFLVINRTNIFQKSGLLFPSFQLTKEIFPQIFAYSGSQYFKNRDEITHFLSYFGIYLKPFMMRKK